MGDYRMGSLKKIEDPIFCSYFIVAAFVLIYATLVSVKMVQAAGKIHQHMLDKIMRAPMEFFDTTPLGRIINRFSSDVEMMDTALPLTFRITLNSLYLAVTTVIVICINTPIILSTVVPLMICYGVIMVSMGTELVVILLHYFATSHVFIH